MGEVHRQKEMARERVYHAESQNSHVLMETSKQPEKLCL